MAAAVLCKLKTMKRPFNLREIDGEPKGSSKFQNSKHACIAEAHESARKRLEATPPKDHDDPIAEKGFNSLSHYDHEDHIAGKGDNSLQHYNLVHNFIPMPQAMQILAVKAAVDKEWEKIGDNFGVEHDESQE